jgi:hypothetical protein
MVMLVFLKIILCHASCFNLTWSSGPNHRIGPELQVSFNSKDKLTAISPLRPLSPHVLSPREACSGTFERDAFIGEGGGGGGGKRGEIYTDLSVKLYYNFVYKNNTPFR